MKKTKYRYLFLTAAILSFVPAGLAAEASDQNEILRIRRELAQVQAERARVRQDAARDRSEQEEYVKRQESRVAALVAETDSVYRECTAERTTSDSLSGMIGSQKNRQRQYGLLQERFRAGLLTASDSVITSLRRMPPMAGAGIVSSISLLRAELVSKSVDNVEALQRLDQMVRDLYEATMSIQDLQGEPPVSEISTTAGNIRIGAVLQAAVDEKVSIAAVWLGADSSGIPRWGVFKDPKLATAVANVVAMRQGKALPAIVSLPFGKGATATPGAP